eukprot:12542956-Ditylum_brightwellii.AAC.1
MLGVYKAATLDESDEFNYLLDRTTLYVQATGACSLKPHKTWLGYTTVYRLCVQYPLSTISLNDQQIDKTHTMIVPCMGYSCTFPSAVVFGLKFSGVRHVRTGTKTGRKLILMTRWTQLSAGTGIPILEETRDLTYSEVCMNNPWMLVPQCEQDTAIMDQALFVLDLSSLDGKYLTDFMYANEHPTTVH